MLRMLSLEIPPTATSSATAVSAMHSGPAAVTRLDAEGATNPFTDDDDSAEIVEMAASAARFQEGDMILKVRGVWKFEEVDGDGTSRRGSVPFLSV
mmetsp:Transcript_22076/g.53464  ORF Transcript_22076/g.53464 Transcript_22076/m.53464 type:complete len:96 (-) Transcript_22076:10-297(-)